MSILSLHLPPPSQKIHPAKVRASATFLRQQHLPLGPHLASQWSAARLCASCSAALSVPPFIRSIASKTIWPCARHGGRERWGVGARAERRSEQRGTAGQRQPTLSATPNSGTMRAWPQSLSMAASRHTALECTPDPSSNTCSRAVPNTAAHPMGGKNSANSLAGAAAHQRKGSGLACRRILAAAGRASA